MLYEITMVSGEKHLSEMSDKLLESFSANRSGLRRIRNKKGIETGLLLNFNYVESITPVVEQEPAVRFSVPQVGDHVEKALEDLKGAVDDMGANDGTGPGPNTQKGEKTGQAKKKSKTG
jgi:hypothetical protein